MPKVKVKDVEMYYEEQGSGEETFIFVHGGSSEGGAYWQGMLEMLPAEYHVYTIDLPGYGRSTSRKGPFEFNPLPDYVHRFSLELGLGKFICVGLSLGGQVGFRLALDHPEIVKAFISIVSIPLRTTMVVDPEVFKALESGDAGAYLAAQERQLFPVPTSDKTRLLRRERYLQLMVKDAMPASAEDLSFMRSQMPRVNESRAETLAHLGEIKVPTLLLLGGQDNLNPIEQSVSAAMAIPGAKAVFFQGYGHGLRTESPEKLVDEIILFVNQLNRTRPLS
jgi:pimeloyl-ACP methyl ester carboxylesterase